MSKYEVGDKATIEILGKSMTEYIVEDYTRKRIYFDTKSLDGISEPLSNYTEPLEAKIRRQAAEITRLLEENKMLKDEMEDCELSECQEKGNAEIVRCKDCKHATFYNCKNDACYKRIICEYGIGTDDENFYCAYGEARTPKEKDGR